MKTILTATAVVALLSGRAYAAIEIPDVSGNAVVAKVNVCGSKLTIRPPVGKVTLDDSTKDSWKVIQCGRPLAEYLFHHGVGAAESVDYANWFAFGAQSVGQYNIKPPNYRADLRLINKIKGMCGVIATLDCVYDFLQNATNDDEEKE